VNLSQMDWLTLTNWIVSGAISLIFGLIGGWVAYRLERKRDDIAWERKQEELTRQFQHDKQLLEAQFEQKFRESEQRRLEQQEAERRAVLLKGLDNPPVLIKTIEHTRGMLVPPPIRTELLHKEPTILAWLIGMDGQSFRLLDDETTIGRDPGSDLILDDPSVSSHHAKVKLEGKEFILYNLAKVIPTRVNDREVTRYILVDGDQVEIGKQRFLFKRVGDDEDQECSVEAK